MSTLTVTGPVTAAPPTPPRVAPAWRGAARSGAGRLLGFLAVVAPIVLLSSFITYCLGAISDNDPAATILGQQATPASVARLDRSLGLDQPLLVQYWHWLARALRGDLGVSYFSGIPVTHSIAQRLPVDLSVAVLAVLLAVVIGGGAGIAAAVRRGTWVDRTVTIASSAVSTLPAFVIGIMLVVLLATSAHLLPANGYVGPTTSVPQWLAHLILPALALSLQVSADIARQLRTSLVEVLEQNYIVGAKVRGLAGRRVLLGHALRNAAGPAITVLGYDFPIMLAGAVAAEAVFSLPGLGQLLLQSAQSRDIPVVQGLLLVTSLIVVVVNLGVNTILNRLHGSQGIVGS